MHWDKIPRVLLPQQTAERLRAKILSQCKPGDLLDSETVLAKKLGVSVATMRSAMQILTQEGLVERRQKRGTIVLEPPTNRHVGILLELDIVHPRASQFYMRVTYRLRKRFADAQIPVKLYFGDVAPGEDIAHTTCADFLKAAEDNKLSAAIGLASTPRDGWLETLQKRGVPAVGSLESYPYGVGFDMALIAEAGIKRLLAMGCRKPVMIGLDWQTRSNELQDQIFCDTLRSAGLSPDATRQIRRVNSGQPGAAWEAVRDFWIFSQEKPDGLLVADDTLLQDAVLALLELGIKVPQELKVVSHTNKGVQFFYPFPLTCLETDPEEMADSVFDMCTTLMRGQSPAQARRLLSATISDYLPPSSVVISQKPSPTKNYEIAQ